MYTDLSLFGYIAKSDDSLSEKVWDEIKREPEYDGPNGVRVITFLELGKSIV